MTFCQCMLIMGRDAELTEISILSLYFFGKIRIELVKAYIMAITTEKTSSVVLRAIYSRDGKDLDQQIMRGRDTGANWANGADEAQGSLNRALAAAVSQLDNDVVSHCHSATPAK